MGRQVLQRRCRTERRVLRAHRDTRPRWLRAHDARPLSGLPAHDASLDTAISQGYTFRRGFEIRLSPASLTPARGVCMRIILFVPAILIVASPVMAVPPCDDAIGNGSIGIFTEPEAAGSCTQAPPFTFVQLYIVATLQG